ncbi:MAG: hypothetical protein Q9157_000513 [Trypethelium eluteriae]
MDRIERLLSRPTAKPYRSRDLEASETPFLNAQGHLDFAPGDVENPKEWSRPRRCSALSNAPGVLADIWGPVDRGNAMGLFSMMTFIGPSLGPVISGFLQLKEDWRWNFYVLLWLAGATEILMFTIPETLPSIVLLNKARRLRALKIPGYENVQAPVEATDRTLAGIFKVALLRPWQILFDPISFLVAIYVGVVYALLYMLFTIYPIVFQQKRHWNAGVGELPLIGTIVGAVMAAGIVFYNSSRDVKRMLAGHTQRPEDRLPLAMLGGVMFAITMFWFAWSGEYNSVHWIVPTLAGVFLSCSILLIFVAFLNYITDTYLMFAASALAANTIMRSACGAAAPLFTQYMFDALGVGGGGSLIGGVATLLAPIPFIFYWKGETIRRRSRFAPTENKPKQEDKPADDEQQQERDISDDLEKDETSPSRQVTTSSESDLSRVRSREVEAGQEGARTDDGELRTATGEVVETEKDLEKHQAYRKETR